MFGCRNERLKGIRAGIVRRVEQATTVEGGQDQLRRALRVLVSNHRSELRFSTPDLLRHVSK